jgi:hypothetical protein
MYVFISPIRILLNLFPSCYSGCFLKRPSISPYFSSEASAACGCSSSFLVCSWANRLNFLSFEITFLDTFITLIFDMGDLFNSPSSNWSSSSDDCDESEPPSVVSEDCPFGSAIKLQISSFSKRRLRLGS